MFSKEELYRISIRALIFGTVIIICIASIGLAAFVSGCENDKVIKDITYLMNIRYNGYSEDDKEFINDKCSTNFAKELNSQFEKNSDERLDYIDINSYLDNLSKNVGISVDELVKSIPFDTVIRSDEWGYRIYREDVQYRMSDDIVPVMIGENCNFEFNSDGINWTKGNSGYLFNIAEYSIYNNGIIKLIYVSDNEERVVKVKVHVNEDKKISNIENINSITGNIN